MITSEYVGELPRQSTKTGHKPSGYTNTGVQLITNDPQNGVASKDSAYGLANCWG